MSIRRNSVSCGARISENNLETDLRVVGNHFGTNRYDCYLMETGEKEGRPVALSLTSQAITEARV